MAEYRSERRASALTPSIHLTIHKTVVNFNGKACSVTVSDGKGILTHWLAQSSYSVKALTLADIKSTVLKRIYHRIWKNSALQ